MELVALPVEEGSLGEVHLGRYLLHPLCVGRCAEQTNTGRISRKRTVGKGVDLKD